MVMFFNWVDLWPAVAIISPFSPSGWKSRAGQLKPEGDRERNAKPKGNIQQIGHNGEECSQNFRWEPTSAEKDIRE